MPTRKPKHNQCQRAKRYNTNLDNIFRANSSRSKLMKKHSFSTFSKQRHSRVSIVHISNAEKPIEMGNPQIRVSDYGKQHNVLLQKRRSTISVKRMNKSLLEFNSNNKTTNHRTSITKIPRSQLSTKQPEIKLD